MRVVCADEPAGGDGPARAGTEALRLCSIPDTSADALLEISVEGSRDPDDSWSVLASIDRASCMFPSGPSTGAGCSTIRQLLKPASKKMKVYLVTCEIKKSDLHSNGSEQCD